MRPFELLKKALDHGEWSDETVGIADVAADLVDALERDLTLEEYDWEDDKIVDLCDKLEEEIKETDEAEDEEEEEEDEDEDDDDDEEFEGIDEEDEDE